MHGSVDQERATKWLVAVGLLALTLALATIGRSTEPEPVADPVRIVFPDATPNDPLIFWSTND